MTSANLAAIFQPGMLSHPDHDMKPLEYRLSQDVLIFLIENQDSFLVGMSGTAIGAQTVRDVQSGAQARPSESPRPTHTGLGRSTSNASAGADSLRKYGALRRNVSVSSKNSRNSANVSSPGSPAPGTPKAGSSGSSVQRSNTVPSKKSPGLPSPRFNRPSGPTTPTSSTPTPGGYLAAKRATSPGFRLAQANAEGGASSNASPIVQNTERSPGLPTVEESNQKIPTQEKLSTPDRLTLQPPQNFASQVPVGTPGKERKLSALFSKSPTGDNDRRDDRQPNKLRKKRLPDGSMPSAHSSTHSLHHVPDSPSNSAFYTPLPTPGIGEHLREDSMSAAPPTLSNTDATPSTENPPRLDNGVYVYDSNTLSPTSKARDDSGLSPKPSKSDASSINSKSSATDHSDQGQSDDPLREGRESKPKRKSRWRMYLSSRLDLHI